MLPKFLIIGTMKGGTTSLYHYLSSHTDVEPSSIKETNFFTTKEDFSKGFTWYESLYKKNKYAFEASPNYTKRHIFPGVPERIFSVLPDVKLIYILRDPIDRIVSHYIHNYAHGRELHKFSDAIKESNSNYIQTSKYYFQLQAYLEYFSEKQLFITESAKLRKDPLNTLYDIFNFLGIPYDTFNSTGVFEKKFHESASKNRRSLFEQELSKRTKNRFLLAAIQKITKPFRQPIKKPVLSFAEKESLQNELAPDVEKLRQFTGMKFSEWSL